MSLNPGLGSEINLYHLKTKSLVLIGYVAIETAHICIGSSSNRRFKLRKLMDTA
jgi:hypothetical protein